jgi:hypothetical protein
LLIGVDRGKGKDRYTGCPAIDESFSIEGILANPEITLKAIFGEKHRQVDRVRL